MRLEGTQFNKSAKKLDDKEQLTDAEKEKLGIPTKFKMTREEARTHAEVLRRQRILQGEEGGKARKKLGEKLKKLSPETISRAKRAGQEREEAGR